ncbi:MAG: PAS domain S-box protein [Anaerolineae bacterium]|nr:PAS domain S-box protein [Anaerolineae bacterium]
MLLLPDYRVRQRDLLLEIIRAMTAQLDLGEVLKLVLKASVAMLAGHGVGFIALRNPATDDYAIRAILNIDTDKLPELESQLAELVAGVSEGQKFDDLEDNLQQMAELIDPELRQLFPMPLVMAGEPVGLLLVFRDYVGVTTPNDLQMLKSFADQAAIAVHNAQLYERVNRERQRLDAFVRHSADGVMILDTQRKIVMFNPALERMTAWNSADALGCHEEEVIVWGVVEPGNLQDAMLAGWPKKPSQDDTPETRHVEGDIVRLDGLTLGVAITYVPLYSSDGKLVNVIANVRDITSFRRAQEMQNVFISGISHELKTPVALIKGYAGTLRREDASWDVQVIRDGLLVIEDEADRLTDLIENLLAASKLQAERMRLTLTDVRLDELAARAVERFQVQSSKHRFQLTFPAHLPVIQGDAAGLRRVFDNLLSNAVKYSPEGGVIEVGGSASEKTVSVYVRDQGVGISPDEQDHIFDRFYRVDGALSRKTQGTGLGLYLTKAIIEAHNGKIHVESKPGEGSTFIIILPLS